MTITEFNRRNVLNLNPEDAYVRKAHSICREWIGGKETFTLTTSGSTGPPKKIVVSRAQLKASVVATSHALSLHKGTRALICLNIEYIAGFMMLIRAMELDWEAVLIQPTGNPLMGTPSGLDFDFTAMVPMQLAEILSNPETAVRAPKLGKILLGGVALSPSQAVSFRKMEQEIYVSYGMTETVSHVALRNIHGADDSYEVIGDTEFGTDDRGCLFFKGAITRQELVQTNDLGTVIPDRRAFRLHGRIDHTINSGGLKIQLEEMEVRLESIFSDNNLPNRFFLWKISDDRLGEALVLVIEGSPILKSRVSTLLQQRIERLKQPKKIYFTDLFLTTGSGKVDKYSTFERSTTL